MQVASVSVMSNLKFFLKFAGAWKHVFDTIIVCQTNVMVEQ